MRFPSPRTIVVQIMVIGGLWAVSLSTALFSKERVPENHGGAVSCQTVSRTLYVPGQLARFARRHPSIESHAQLAALLEKEGIREAWYATHYLDMTSAGERQDRVICADVAGVTHRFDIIQDDFAAIAGRSVAKRNPQALEAKVVVIPGEVAGLNPRAVLSDLLEISKAQ